MNRKVGTIQGIGTDIVAVERIRMALKRHKERFTKRIFTDQELRYCLKFSDPAPQLAGRFAAKEAVAKALGTGIGEKLSWQDIEIVKKTSGQPYIQLSQPAQKTFIFPELLLSISHCREYATAMVLWTIPL